MATPAEVPLTGDAFYLRLRAYVARLRLEGLAVGADRESRLFLLLSRLESAGAMPKAAGALARFVVPVLAGTPAQQEMCHDLFRSMFSEADVALDGSERLSASGEAEEQKTWLQRILRTGIMRMLAAFVIVVMVALVVLAVQAIDTRPVGKPGIPREQPGVQVDASKLLLDWIRDFPITELELPKQAPWNRTLRWYYTEFGWEKSAVAVLPWLVFVAAFCGLVYLTLAHLRRESLRQNLRTLPLSFRGNRPRFGDRVLIADLQPLRFLARDELREIDPEATAVATAAQGGLLMPRWRTRPVPADFVVLIDRRSPRDHLASYAETMVATLRNAGLFVEQFEFDRSPWICRRTRSGEIETLSSVLGRIPGAIFLFFVSESELLDPASGAPKSWLGEISDVARTFLVVPEEASGASALGWALPKGLMVAHTSPAGIRAVAARLLAQAVPDTAHGGTAPALARLVARINERADRWMQGAVPAATEVERLFAELQLAAGAKTYRWIAATSAYPELRWPMTLYLRDRMGGPSGQPATLAPDLLGVVQLPWFRRGWMPDWVRTALLKRLSEPDRRKVRTVLLEAMGITTATQPMAGAMEVSARSQAGTPPAERIRSDRILVNYLLPNLASASQFFVLPEEWAKKIARRPLRRLAIAAACGAMLAAVGSLGALSLMPIDECDLWGTSPFQTDAIGPPQKSFLLERGGHARKVMAACKEAMDRAPEKVRVRYQYARALSNTPNIQTVEKKIVSDILFDLEKNKYVAAINSIGFAYERGTLFTRDLVKAAEYFRRASELGSLDAIRNLSIVYEYAEFNNDFYNRERRRLLEEYLNRGGDGLDNYARSLRDGTYGFVPDFHRYIEVVKLGVDRKDGHSANLLADLYASGEICDECSEDYKTANKYYLKAIEWSASPNAAAKLARNYFLERGAKYNVEQALYWAVFAIRFGQAHTIDLIYDIIARTDTTKLVELGLDPGVMTDRLLDSAKSGNEYSQYYYGRMLEARGNTEEALVWYRKASDRLPLARDAVDRLSEKNNGK